MWMSQPTPVTTSTMTTVSWSICKSKPARKFPAVIQAKNSLRKRTCPESKNSRTASSAHRNDRPVEPIAAMLTILFGHFAPKSPLIAEPSSGSSGMIHKYSRIGCAGIRV